MQVAAALNAQQQYRSAAAASLQNPYVKNVGGSQQQMSGNRVFLIKQSITVFLIVFNFAGDQCQRPQQLKSPSSQEVLSSVFSGKALLLPGIEKQNDLFI